MDEDLSEQNMNTLQEMVFDEEKLVSYLSLSKELCIHVNSSKSLLKSFTEKIIKKKPEIGLNIQYVVSGLCEDGQARTMVCPEEELDKRRPLFKIIFFEHIYSVCKGSAKVDEVALSLVNRFEDFSLCYGLVKNSECVKRTSDEMGALKTISQEVVKQPLQKPQASKSFFGNKKVKEEKKELNDEVSKKISEKTCKINGESSSSNINGTSSKTEVKPSVKAEPVSPNKNENNKSVSPKKNQAAKTKPESKNQKGIAGFFSKQNGAPPKKTPKETVEVKKEENKPVEKIEKKNSIKEEQMDVDEDQKTPVQKTNWHKKSTESKTNGHKSSTEPKTKASKLNQIKKTAKVDKKRKRVLHVSDSESDGEKDDPFAEEPLMDTHDSEDEIPQTPNVSTVKITSGIVNPKKKRKIVDKTYTDEDGYILTKKVEVYESCSDNEDEGHSKENIVNTVQVIKESPKETKAPARASKKKISPPQKGKQATLMNFFQKK